MLIAGWPTVARHERMRPDAGRFYSSPGNGATARSERLDEQSDGQADDIEEAPLDVRHECGTRLLDCVRARASTPFASRHICLDGVLLELAQAHGRARVSRPLVLGIAQRQTGHDLVRPSGEQSQHARSLGGVRRLAEHLPVDHDERVDAQHRLPWAGLDRARLSAAVLLGELVRRHRQRQLLVRRLLHAERESELREDRAALRRARRQDERHSAAGRSSPGAKYSGNSRAALSDESDPCTMFSLSTSAKSPRMVPGAESSGFVAPIIVRTVAIASCPSRARATSGPEVMNATSSPKNG